METKALVVRSWDDLVFTNRNREYGAYSIRQSYSRRLMIGFGVTNAALALLFVLLHISQGGKIRIPIPLPPDKGEHILEDYRVIPKPPKFQHIPREQQVVRPTSNVVQVVTDQVAYTDIETQPLESPMTDEGVDTGVGTPDGTATGLTDIPVVEVPTDKIHIIVEQMPEYEGGAKEMMKFIKRKIRFPRSAEIQQISGSVYVSFVVNGDGKVSQVTVLRGISKDCDEEAVRVISMLPGWIGGKQNGNPVSVRMVLPITFNTNR
jgi:periplasmic protein TonB